MPWMIGLSGADSWLTAAGVGVVAGAGSDGPGVVGAGDVHAQRLTIAQAATVVAKRRGMVIRFVQLQFV